MRSSTSSGGLRGMLRDLGDFLLNGLDKLEKFGIEVKQDRPDWFWIETVDPKNDNAPVKLKMHVTPLDQKATRFDIEIYLPDGKTVKEENVRQKDLDDVLVKVLEDAKLGGLENAGEIHMSNNIRATFKKVTSAEEESIELVAIQANSDPAQAFAVVQELAESPEFIAQLSDEPQSFLIEDAGCEYDVTECDCIDTSGTYVLMLKTALQTLSVAQSIHWNSRGDDFFTIHQLMDEYIWKLRNQVDELAELCVEFNTFVASPIDLVKDVDSNVDYMQKFSAVQGYNSFKNQVDKLISVYSALYCNCPSDVQSELDTWIREWKKESQYKLASALS